MATGGKDAGTEKEKMERELEKEGICVSNVLMDDWNDYKEMATLERADWLTERALSVDTHYDDPEERFCDLSLALYYRTHIYGKFALECAKSYHDYGFSLMFYRRYEFCQHKIDENSGNDSSPLAPKKLIGEDSTEELLPEDLLSDPDVYCDCKLHLLAVAWDSLAIAKKIIEKDPRDSSLKADIYYDFADASYMLYKRDKCYSAYRAALPLIEHVDPNDSRLALLYRMVGAIVGPREALPYYKQALARYESHLKSLGEMRSDLPWCQKNEILGTQMSVEQLRQRIEELEDSAVSLEPPLRKAEDGEGRRRLRSF